MKKVAELKDNEVRAIVYLDVTGDYTFEARLLSFDVQAGPRERQTGVTRQKQVGNGLFSCFLAYRGKPW